MLLCQERLVFDGGVDGAGEMSLKAAKGFTTALAVGLTPFEVGARRRVHACLGDRDLMQRTVELTVAAAVEAVPLVFAAAGLKRCDAGVPGELRV